MGIIIHKQLDRPKFIKYEKKYATGEHFAMTQAPYVIGKLMMNYRETEIADFKARQLQYVYRQVPGYNIFFIQAGFSEAPDHIIKDSEIETALNDLCKWYKETVIIRNNFKFNRYKIK